MRTLTGNRLIHSMTHCSGALHPHSRQNARGINSFVLTSSWDTFRTVHPLLSLTSPVEWAEIVNAYIDGWRHTGATNLPMLCAVLTPYYVLFVQDIFRSAGLTPRSKLPAYWRRIRALSTWYRGYVQGGSDGMPILGQFAVVYGSMAAQLGVPADDLYQALVDTAENTVCPQFTARCVHDLIQSSH